MNTVNTVIEFGSTAVLEAPAVRVIETPSALPAADYLWFDCSGESLE
jgi:hypothetical protein